MSISQLDLFGGSAPPTGMKMQKRVAYVLENWPEAPDDDNALFVGYLVLFGHLRRDEAERWQKVLDNAPSFETLRRRRQELQNDLRAFRASEPVREWREARAGAGPIR